MPIDFIKAEIIGMTPQDFANNKLLKPPTSIYSGELLTKTIYSFKNLKIRVFENNNRIEFLGSLHTFYNDGKHNYNDFNQAMFNDALELIFITLRIRPSNLYLIHLEWGYNIQPPYYTNPVLNSLIQHKSVNKTVGIDCNTEGKYCQFKHSTMMLKVYNKGMHFNLKDEVLRIEIKQTNWSRYRQIGIKTLEDFINSDKTVFIKELIRQWNRIIFYDLHDLNDHVYYKYNNHVYWDNLRKTRSGKNFKYHSDKLKRLNIEIGNDTQNKIANLLIDKGKELQL